MPKEKRAERFTKRLEAEFTAAGKTHKGFLSNVSETGIFIRTKQSYREGSPLDIKIFLPDGRASNIKGIVRRAITADASMMAKTGMGIELTHKDKNFLDFLNQVGGGRAGKAEEAKEPPGKQPEARQVEFLIIACKACGVKNKVPSDKLSLGPRCGGCKEPLQTG